MIGLATAGSEFDVVSAALDPSGSGSWRKSGRSTLSLPLCDPAGGWSFPFWLKSGSSKRSLNWSSLISPVDSTLILFSSSSWDEEFSYGRFDGWLISSSFGADMAVVCYGVR